MTVLNLSFAAPVVLAVQFVATAPVLALSFKPAEVLPVELVQAPLLRLSFRPPQVLDAVLIPVLIGPPGEALAPVSRTLTWSSGRLTGVAYADGRSKALTWTGGQLTRVDHLRPSLPTLRADLSYNLDGTLAAVTQSEA